MGDIMVRTADRQDMALAEQSISDLASMLRGPVLTPASPEYDEVRQIWNGMIDRRPGFIVRCAGAADVMNAVRFAREQGLLVSVRGGGHNIAGSALCDGGMLIDLAPMRFVHVDPASRTARVGPGATLGDLDRETQAFGLAVPVGINSTTGVAGLTLGGGSGLPASMG
jgi:FAD/FMN-containing dehydrogenase